jgi:hypothetical protein
MLKTFTTLSITILVLLLFSISGAYASDDLFALVTSPKLQDTQGNELSSASVGQLVIISTQFVTKDSTPYVLIIEARDEKGMTVFAQFAIGEIDAFGQTTIGLSWSPDEPGEYLLRSFALTSFDNFVPLTTISESTVRISN